LYYFTAAVLSFVDLLVISIGIRVFLNAHSIGFISFALQVFYACRTGLAEPEIYWIQLSRPNNQGGDLKNKKLVQFLLFNIKMKKVARILN
jgi:hypothetical protein